jgi:TolB protein
MKVITPTSVLAIFITIIFTSFTTVSAQEKNTFNSIVGVKDSYPCISKDGKKIVFQSNRTGKWEIYTMDTSGKNILQLTSGIEEANTPVWSPDGRQIVFCKDLNDNSEIYIMNADGKNPRRLTNQPGDDSHPKFSPDGNYIIFNSARTSPDLSIDWGKQWLEIFIMKTDGTELKQVTSFKTISTYPSISPDGKKICFRKVISEPGFNWDLSTAKRNSEVFVMNIDGTNAINISNNSAFDGWPAWTNSGDIIFSSNRGGIANEAQLYKSDPEGNKTVLIYSKKGALVQASLSPDGRKIYCYHNIENADFEYGGIATIDLVKTYLR